MINNYLLYLLIYNIFFKSKTLYPFLKKIKYSLYIYLKSIILFLLFFHKIDLWIQKRTIFFINYRSTRRLWFNFSLCLFFKNIYIWYKFCMCVRLVHWIVSYFRITCCLYKSFFIIWIFNISILFLRIVQIFCIVFILYYPD